MKKGKKIKPWYIIIFILIIIWLSLYIFLRPQNKNKDWISYENPNYGITLQYPNNRTTKTVQNTIFSAFSPIEQDWDKFQENINLVISNNFGQNLDKFSAQQIDILKKSTNFENFVLEDEWYTNFGWSDWYKIIYTGKLKWYDIPLKRMQMWTLKWNSAYIFTYNAEQSNFDKYIDKINEILKSLKIK